MNRFVALEPYQYDAGVYHYRGAGGGTDVFPGKIVDVLGLDGVVFKNLRVAYLSEPENGIVQITLENDQLVDPRPSWIGRPLKESDLRILRFDLSNLD